MYGFESNNAIFTVPDSHVVMVRYNKEHVVNNTQVNLYLEIYFTLQCAKSVRGSLLTNSQIVL